MLGQWTAHSKPLIGSLLNGAHPLARGLVGCWPMLEGTGGLVSDYSGNQRNGTLYNMTPETDWVLSPGGIIHGQALEFDGVASNDNMEIDALALLLAGASQYSMVAWLQAGSNFVNTDVVYSLFEDANNYDAVYHGGTNWYTLHRRGGQSNRGQSTYPVTAGEWLHMVQTFDGTQAAELDRTCLYLNGTNVITSEAGTIPTTVCAATQACIGGAGSGASVTVEGNIVIAYFALYDRALQPVDVELSAREPFGHLAPLASPAIFGAGVAVSAADYYRRIGLNRRGRAA